MIYFIVFLIAIFLIVYSGKSLSTCDVPPNEFKRARVIFTFAACLFFVIAVKFIVAMF